MLTLEKSTTTSGPKTGTLGSVFQLLAVFQLPPAFLVHT